MRVFFSSTSQALNSLRRLSCQAIFVALLFWYHFFHHSRFLAGLSLASIKRSYHRLKPRKVSMKLLQHWRIFKSDPRGWVTERWLYLRCRVGGHKKPYLKKMNCELCSRCLAVMSYHGQLSRRLTTNREGSDGGGEG